MNAKRLISILFAGTFTLTACATAAPTQTANYVPGTQAVAQTQVVRETQVAVVYPTLAPAATSAYVETYATAAPTQGLFEPTTTAPNDMYFQNYGVNPFIDTTEDHLSTFALDVDTASYTLARRYVNDGNIPPADSVRVEEFVNYFDQGYPLPAGAAFGIYADGAPSPFQHDATQILRFGIQGYSVPDSQRKPASLTFAVDVSGSMAREDRLGLVKQSLHLLVDRLRPDDTVSLVVYGTDARVLLLPTSGEDRGAILRAIDALQPEGATNAEAGLALAYNLADQAFRPGAINRVILCSDGVANVGATGPNEILETIHRYADQGVTLTTVGFGMGNFNDVLMEQLADKGNGSYAYVDTLAAAQDLFVDKLTGTLQVIALDAKVQVDFNPDTVARYRLIGYENRAVADENFRNDSVDAGEIGAGHTATALYAVQLRPAASGRLATVQLRWEDPDSHAVQEINGNFNTFDLAPSFEAASPRYQLAVTVAQYAELLRHSPWTYESSMNQILNESARLAELLPGDEQVREFNSLAWRAAQISGY